MYSENAMNQDFNGVQNNQGEQNGYQSDENEEEIDSTNKTKYDPLAQMTGGEGSVQQVQKMTEDMQIISTKDDTARVGENMNYIQSMSVEVPSFEEKKVDGGKNNVMFFKVIFGFIKGNKRWALEKRYSEFDQLDKTLKENYPNIPSLPGKTLFKMSDSASIENRRKVLNEYMKALINRKDLRGCQAYRKFMQIEQHFGNSVSFEAKRIAQMKDFSKGVRDFIYLPQYNSIFVALSDMNLITRMDSYFTNITLPWEKKKDKQKKKESVLTEEAVSTVGALQHYRISEGNNQPSNNGLEQRWQTQASWAKTYGSQTNIMHWCDQQSILYLGLDSGLIHRYHCQKDKKLSVMKELSEITVHNVQMRIMGISVDPRVNHMFSISESGYLIVTDLNDTDIEGGKFLFSQNLCSANGLKAMIHDIQRNVLFIASGKGEIYLMNSIPSNPELLCKVETDQKVCIRGLTRSMNLNNYWPQQAIKPAQSHNYIMASDVNGYITIFDIGAPGKERLTKRVGNTQGKPKQRIVLWRDHGREIISGDEDGCVTFWYSKEGTPLYVLKAHNGPITQMRWNEELQQLITGSKDQAVKMWQLPSCWIDESGTKQQQQDFNNYPKPNPNNHLQTGVDGDTLWGGQHNVQKQQANLGTNSQGSSDDEEEKYQEPVKAQKPPAQNVKPVQQDNDSDDEDLMGWNK